MANVQAFFSCIHQGENTVIRGNKVMPLGSNQNWATRGSNARVDDHNVNGSGREVRVGLSYGQRAIEDIEGLHGMSDVHDFGFRNDI